MKRIIVDMSKGELDFIREALKTKHINLMSYLDTCEENANPKPSWEKVAEIVEAEFDKELAKLTGKKYDFSDEPVKEPAPYGLKKDGTPKKKSGRPTKEFF
jgi:hypothetical protein